LTAAAGSGGAVLADLHVHVGRAVGRVVKVTASERLTVRGIIEESATRKGLHAVGIVDAHSPHVLRELEDLVAAGDLEALGGGGLRWKGDVPLLLVLASEVEVEEEGVGAVHHLCFLPDLEVCRGFSDFLARRVSNIGLSSQKARASGDELALWVGREGGFLVPAHVFTPHKGFFGQGGSDLRQVFSDRALEFVPAVELGLSADTAMADRVPSLRGFTFLSNSDAHSPETIAREHNALLPEEGPDGLDFKALAGAVRLGAVAANYGLDPRLGKYHRAWCPSCGWVPDGGDGPGPGRDRGRRRCPSCGRPGVVGGVFDRVEELAARQPHPKDAAGRRRGEGGRRPPYVHHIPLRQVPGVGPKTLEVLLEAFGTEMRVLHGATREELTEVVGPELAARIAAARGDTSALDILPGAGGRYGRVLLAGDRSRGRRRRAGDDGDRPKADPA